MKKLLPILAVVALGVVMIGCKPKEDESATSGTPATGIKDKTPKTDDEAETKADKP